MQQSYPASAAIALRPLRERRLLEGVIARLPGFASLAREDLEVLAEYSRLTDYRRGALVAKRGEPMPGVIAIVEGSAKLALRRNGGEEQVARIVEAGECFGFAAVLLERHCPVDVVALTNCVVAAIPPMPLQRLMLQHASFAVAVARTLAGRVLDLVGELEACVQQSSLQRLAGYLESRAQPAGDKGKGGWLVRLPVTKTTIAARLGVKKETMSRMLRELSARGVIAVCGPEIAILDRDGLARLAAFSD